MSYPFEIPGYVQGHRFSSAKEFYDPVSKRFKDLAGYDHLGNGLTINLGDPIFETINGQVGLKLNNSFHGFFRSAIPWMGMMLAVLKPTFLSGSTLTRYLHLYGDAITPSSNGNLKIIHSSGARIVRLSTSGDVLQVSASRNDNNTVVVACAFDQQTRKGYVTTDGITVTEVAGPVSALNGNSIGLGAGLAGARFGNLTGTAGDQTPLTDLFCYAFEQHFYKGNPLITDLATVKSAIDRLKVKYPN